MKQLKSIYLLSLIVLTFIGCTKMDHHYRGFLEAGETKYVGKVDSIKVYPGHNRIKLSWKLNPDPAVTYAWVYWTAEGVLDSTKVDFAAFKAVDTAFVILDDLSEGDYVFSIYTFDTHQNKSVRMEKGGKVYGERYANFIIPTTYVTAAYKDAKYQINWLLNTDTTAIGSLVSYVDVQGEAGTYFVEPTETMSVIDDVDPAKPVFYQTLYKPHHLAIDTFKTAYVEVSASISAPNLINKDAWQLLNITPGVTFSLQQDGSYVAAGGSSGHAGIFQGVEVEAGKQYTLDMYVQGNVATNVWFEVYLGTAVPVQGGEYNNGGNRMGLSTWSAGCAINTVNYSGQLSVIRCGGSGNKVTFPESGTVYFVIRTGGANLGTGGIKISNIEMRGPSLN